MPRCPEVSAQPTSEIVAGPLGAAMMLYIRGVTEANRAAGVLAEQAGASVGEFASATAAFAIEHAAWSLLSGALSNGATSADFDPVAFGRAAERVARETLPRFVRDCECEGMARQ